MNYGFRYRSTHPTSLRHDQLSTQLPSWRNFFFTVNLAERRFVVDRAHRTLRPAFRETRSCTSVFSRGDVGLPGSPACDLDLAGGRRGLCDTLAADQIVVLTGAAARRANSLSRKRQAERGIWQRRYWEHTIGDDTDFARHVDYIHINPVKHGYVTRVRDWPYSSFRRMVRDGTYPEDWAGDAAEFKGEFGERS